MRIHQVVNFHFESQILIVDLRSTNTLKRSLKIIYDYYQMDIKAKLKKQQIKTRLARRNYMIAKTRNESELTIKVLFTRWSQQNFICNLWEEAVKRLG
jgi:hypothetical protein